MAEEEKKILEPVGRKKFIQVTLPIIIIIILAPVVLNIILPFFNGGYAAISIMIRGIMLPIVLLILSFPLIKITRRRLKDLNWSGWLCLVFPIAILLLLANGPIRSFTMLGIGGSPLFSDSRFWISLIMLLVLSVLPRREESKLKNPLIGFLYNNLDQQSEKNNLKEYRIIFLCYFAFTAINYFLSFYVIPSYVNDISFMSIYKTIYLVLTIISSVICFTLLVSVYSRMRTLSIHRYFGIITAFFILDLGKFFVFFLLLIHLPINPWFIVIINAGVPLLFFTWLLFAKRVNEKH